MRGRNPPLSERLPFSQRLSIADRKHWVKQWRHLVWATPLFLFVRFVVLISCGGFWYFLITRMSFRSAFSRDFACVVGVFFCIGFSSYLTYEGSRHIISRRIAEELDQERT
jgi:hypothetical protein